MRKERVMLMFGLALAGLLLFGCQRSSYREIYETFPAHNATTNTATPAPTPKPVPPSAATPAIQPPATSATTADTGAGSRVSRVWEHIRFLSPFGVSPGESISRLQPTKVTLEDGALAFKGGGGRWGFLDTIWQRMKDLLWLGLFGGVGLVALYFLVPAAQPILSAIFRVIASIVPVLGSIVERFIGRLKLKKPLVETVKGVEEFKTLLAARKDFTEEQKVAILGILKTAMNTEQDQATQDAIAEIRES